MGRVRLLRLLRRHRAVPAHGAAARAAAAVVNVPFPASGKAGSNAIAPQLYTQTGR